MEKSIFYIAVGYLSGSILFARIAARLFRKDGIIENSKDKNPGTVNAFQYGGFFCGLFTLTGDVLKGFLPVFLYLHGADRISPVSTALVLAAPVFGHAFPAFFRLKGGKGIAVSFGCLLGLLPDWIPAAILAGTFIFFSLILKISPDFYRTAAAFLVSLVLMVILTGFSGISLGFFLITCIVCYRLHISPEEREPMMVKPLWMH